MTADFSKLGKRVRTIRSDMGLGVADLAERSDVSAEAILALEERGEPVPVRDIVAMARSLHWDWESLLEPAGDFEERVLTLFRQNKELTPPDRLVLADFAKRASTLPQLTDGLKPLLAPIQAPAGRYERGNGRLVAEQVRAMLRLGDQPLPSPFELLRHYGIQLFRVEFNADTLAGVTLMHKSFGAAVVIQRRDDLFRQMFSAMHEFGHVLMDREAGAVATFDNEQSTSQERRANGFATGMLLPRSVLQRHWSEWGEVWDAWRPLLIEYRANFGTLFFALADVNIITQEKRKELSRSRPHSITRAEKEDPDKMLRSLGGLAWLDALAGVGLSPELADAAATALAHERFSWASVASKLRVDVDMLRALLGGPPKNLKQELPSDVNTAFA